MNFLKPFFRRAAEEKNEIPNIWRYDDIPINVRIQIFRAFCKAYSYGSMIDTIVDYMRDEIGVNDLAGWQTNSFNDLQYFFYSGQQHTNNIRYLLTIIETMCAVLMSKNNPFNDEMKEIVDTINYRLREARIGWTFNIDAGKLMKIDNDFIYQKAIEPAFRLLSQAKFKESVDNFAKAFEFYQQGAPKDLETAIDYAVKSLESTIRNICVNKKYSFEPNATLHPLIQTLIKNRFLPNYQDDFLISLSKIFEASGVVGNKITRHGKEENKAKETSVLLTDKLVEFVLPQTASTIVFLVESL